jgi:isopenicillin N synthase-like dioxygenase
MKDFDPLEKERQLQHESGAWDTSVVAPANAGDIPVIDVGRYFDTDSDEELEKVAVQLHDACTQVGFFSIVNHRLPIDSLLNVFDETRRFHDLPQATKNRLLMDRADWPVKGVGYLPVKNFKLPARNKGNLNDSFIVKRDHKSTLNDSQWPVESELPAFRKNIETYASHIEALAKRLLPIFARALKLDKAYFLAAFSQALYRLRMTRYPLVPDKDRDEFGIAPHVDTSFFTLLAQNSQGLVIYHEQRQCWIHAPVLENAFIVNTGELLKQWSNDYFISVKHFADNNTEQQMRYSVPFFFNANADYLMACLPSCCDDNNPAKYPAISYLQSQAIVQGE